MENRIAIKITEAQKQEILDAVKALAEKLQHCFSLKFQSFLIIG
jgi:hypothetical protein